MQSVQIFKFSLIWYLKNTCFPQFYRPLNIRIVLVGVEVWNDIDKCSISQDPFTSLHEFLDWRKMKLLPRKSHDNAQLIRQVFLTPFCLEKSRPPHNLSCQLLLHSPKFRCFLQGAQLPHGPFRLHQRGSTILIWSYRSVRKVSLQTS